MTPLPKRKISTRRTGKRRASIRLSLPTLVACTKCGLPHRPHRVCRSCGTYSKNEKPSRPEAQKA